MDWSRALDIDDGMMEILFTDHGNGMILICGYSMPHLASIWQLRCPQPEPMILIL